LRTRSSGRIGHYSTAAEPGVRGRDLAFAVVRSRVPAAFLPPARHIIDDLAVPRRRG